jgi:acyl dehydratase
MGLVHIGNRIEQRRPLDLDEVVDLRVWAERLRPHPRGTELTLVSEAAVAGEVVWRDETVLLRRGAAGPDGGPAQPGGLPEDAPTGPVTWRLDRGLGRRYAAVSGDRNPIHLSALTAKAFGFPRAIAHGMWTKARALAALEPRVPDAFAVEVAFRKPVLLPGAVRLGARQTGQMIDFGVTSGSDRIHLVGRITPLPG